MNLPLKVPQITLIFWVIKLLSTAMGESTSDFLVFGINSYVAVVLGFAGLVAALAIQLRSRDYVPWIYWFAVVMVAVFGTMAADVLHVVIGIPYLVSTVFFLICLAAVFFLWYASEKTLSIHTVVAGRRELFYWATVIATFALGTAAGDLTASTVGIGYFASLILFAVVFLIPAIAWKWFGLNEVAAFWTSYVITRPLGASFADWTGKHTLGGLGIGDGTMAAILTVLIVICVATISLPRLAATPGPDPH